MCVLNGFVSVCVWVGVYVCVCCVCVWDGQTLLSGSVVVGTVNVFVVNSLDCDT